MNFAKLFCCSVVISLAGLHSGWSQEEVTADPNATNLAALEESAKRFVEAYNKGDAEAVAATYLPEGEITLADGTIISGREEIAVFFRDSMKTEEGESAPQVAMEVGSVRFVTPGVAIESGTLLITAPGGDVSAHPYTAVQIKQEDGSWLTGSVRDEIGDEALPSEKLLGLEWLIGDWIIQQNGVDTLLSFEWSEFGPYIEAFAEVVQTYGGEVGLTMRIGWDNQRKGFISWTHDSEGGFVRSDWAEVDQLKWLLRTKGVTADGEENEYTQLCTVDPSRESFTWTIHDQTIGGEPQADRKLVAVKRPPAPNSGKEESK